MLTPACVFKLEEETFVIHICMYLTKQKATTNLNSKHNSQCSQRKEVK